MNMLQWDRIKILNAVWITSIVVAVTTFLLHEFFLAAAPSSYIIKGFDSKSNPLTLELDSSAEFFTVGTFQTKVSIPVLLPALTRFLEIHADDCLIELRSEFGILRGDKLPYCNYRKPFIIPLPQSFESDLYKWKKKLKLWVKFSNTGGKGKIKIMIKPDKSVELFCRLIVLLFGTVAIFLTGLKFKLKNEEE
jgi:hypothetical protein